MVRPASAEILENNYSNDWRDHATTPSEIMSHVLSSGYFSNAELRLGKDKIGRKVIKEILQALSTPLEQRLRLVGDEKLNGENAPIFYFLDIDPEPMDEILEFAYTHQWSWCGDADDLNELPLVLKTLRLAEKLEIKILVQKIQKTLLILLANERGAINDKTVCMVFETAHHFGVENLKFFALQMILRSPKQIFHSPENYAMLSPSSFAEILEKDELEVESELKLFEIAVTWAKSKCEKLGEPGSSVKILRKILKPILPTIRFEQMSAQELTDHVQPTGLLETINENEWLTRISNNFGIHGGRPRKYQKGEDESIKNGALFKKSIDFENGEINFRIEKFTESEKNKLLDTIMTVPPKDESKWVNLTIKLCPDGRDLLSFLQSVAGYQSQLKLELKIDTILKMTPIKSPTVTKFEQIIALHFESLGESAELACLLEILQNAPNLRDLSIGNLAWYLKSPEDSHANLSRVVGTLISLREKNFLPPNFKFSCGLFGSPELTKDTLQLLKREGVSMTTIGLNWSIAIRRFQIIEFLGENLEQIHYLQHQYTTPTFNCNLPKLKILNILCDPKILAGVLKKTPNLEKLIWRSSGSAWCPPKDEIVAHLPFLTSLTLFLRYKENMEQAIQLFANCPKLTQLTCINWYPSPMTLVYEKFPKITHLQICQGGGGGVTTENLMMGGKKSGPYIGNLEELTCLSFGYRDYEYGAFVFKWDLDMEAFTEGICHLSKLEKIIFPPMPLDKARLIVKILDESKSMKGLKLIGLQSWVVEGTKMEGQEDTMTMSEVKNLADDYDIGGAKKFKIEPMPVRPEDSSRVFLY